jgi:hypothetical protein
LNFGKSEHCSCFSVKLIDAWGASWRLAAATWKFPHHHRFDKRKD